MGMFDSFKNTPVNYVPNNMYATDWDATNEITRGADCDQIFILEGDYTKITKSFKAIFRQSFVKIIKELPDLSVRLINGNTFVNAHLKPDDTLPFDFRYKAFSQLELKLISGERIFSKINEIKVINSLPISYTSFKPLRIKAGEGIIIEDGVISVDESVIATKDDLHETTSILEEYTNEQVTQLETYVDEENNSIREYVDEQDDSVKDYVDEKVEEVTLSAGEGISIENKTISVNLQGGEGIDVDGDTISADEEVVATKDFVENQFVVSNVQIEDIVSGD